MKRTGLGRGLSALISSTVPVAPPKDEPKLSNAPDNADTSVLATETKDLSYLAINDLIANPGQPRQHFEQSDLEELANSIRQHGVVQPILVRQGPDGKYQIIAGERRYRASKLVGLAQVPVVIRDLDDRETLEIALIENIQRKDLNPIEEARGYQKLMDAFSLSIQEIAEKVAKDRATVANTIRILKLPPSVIAMVERGEISAGHAKVILSVKEPMAQVGLAEKVRTEGLSVRALEAIVTRQVDLSPRPQPTTAQEASSSAEKEPAVSTEILDRLRRKFGTKIGVHRTANGGYVVNIHCHDDSDLERVVELLGI